MTKNLYFGVQGHSRSSMLILLKSTSPVLVMISSMSVLISNHFHVVQANIGKIPIFRGTPIWHPRAYASLNLGVPDLDC